MIHSITENTCKRSRKTRTLQQGMTNLIQAKAKCLKHAQFITYRSHMPALFCDSIPSKSRHVTQQDIVYMTCACASHLTLNVKHLSRPHNHQFIMLVVFLYNLKLLLIQFRVCSFLPNFKLCRSNSLANPPSAHLDIVLAVFPLSRVKNLRRPWKKTWEQLNVYCWSIATE